MSFVGFGRAILLSLGSNFVYPQKHQDNTNQNKINKKKWIETKIKTCRKYYFPPKFMLQRCTTLIFLLHFLTP